MTKLAIMARVSCAKVGWCISIGRCMAHLFAAWKAATVRLLNSSAKLLDALQRVASR